MAVIRLRFLNQNHVPLDDLELTNSAPIIELLPDILEILQLDADKEWELVIDDRNQIVDLSKSFLEAGLNDGSSLRLLAKSNYLGRYQLGKKIGEGGMGVVYEAYDPNLDRKVCIKIIREKFAKDLQMMERFSREARAVARLTGEENIVHVYDFVQRPHTSTPYFAMEFVNGPSVAELIEQRNRLKPEAVADILQGTAKALDAAHKQGIVHRDIKPGNILLQPDIERPGSWIPKLVDFGLVRISEEASDLTQTGMVIGSPYYMSPEQVLAKPLTERSDIYSLGIVVYEMLTGRRPFHDGATTKIMMEHLSATPPTIDSLQVDVSKAIEDVVLKAIAKDPEERYRSAGDFAHAFQQAIVGVDEPPKERPIVLFALVGILGLVLIGGIVYFMLFNPFQRSPGLLEKAPPQIAFTSERDGNAEIYVMNIDGTAQTNLTKSPSNDFWPRWSPDRSQIIFHSYEPGSNAQVYSDIYVMNNDGANWVRLTNSEGFSKFPDWSPDGNNAVYVSDRDGDYDLYIMNADGSGNTQLTDNIGRDYFPMWSPAGEQILFDSDRNGDTDIFIINRDGSGLTNLTDHPAQDTMASWSPDGQTVAFTSDRSGQKEIWTVNVDGSNLQQVTITGGQQPRWRNDGRNLVYFSDRNGNQDIYVIDIESRKITQLTNAPAADRDASFAR